MTYLGSKSGAGVYQTIINLMPPHQVYIEPFLGTAAVLLKKAPATETIGLDLDQAMITRAENVVEESGYCGSVTLLCANTLDWLENYTPGKSTLIYCDPPYVHSTRTSNKRYKYELNNDDHKRLLARLNNLSAQVIISGYRNPIYEQLIGDWYSKDFQAMTRGGVRTETVWCNFHPKDVHYHTYAGKNFTDRQRIKRKAGRWADNYERLPPGEKQAVLAAILAVGTT